MIQPNIIHLIRKGSAGLKAKIRWIVLEKYGFMRIDVANTTAVRNSIRTGHVYNLCTPNFDLVVRRYRCHAKLSLISSSIKRIFEFKKHNQTEDRGKYIMRRFVVRKGEVTTEFKCHATKKLIVVYV